MSQNLKIEKCLMMQVYYLTNDSLSYNWFLLSSIKPEEYMTSDLSHCHQYILKFILE